MPVLVQKYGGTSVGTPERIEAVADRVVASKASGHDMVVVVSAMGESTDHLLDLAHQIHPKPPQRELDMLLSAGERISMALLAMALHKRGARAASFTGSQSGIITDRGHGRAKIQAVRNCRLSPRAMGSRRIGKLFVNGVGQISTSVQPSSTSMVWSLSSRRQCPRQSVLSASDLLECAVVTVNLASCSCHEPSQMSW